MKLWEQTSADAARAADNRLVVVLPIGAVEQHSLHLPLGTDALIADLVATEVEATAPDTVLRLPTLWVGASDHHLAMPGSVSVGTTVTADAITRQILSLTTSTALTRFLIVNGHGGNQPAARLALEQIRLANPTILAYAVDYWSLMFDVLDRTATPRPAAMGHADLIETSILLARRPELVRSDRIKADAYQDILPTTVHTTLGIPQRTRHGGVGDPTDATAEYGRVCLQAVAMGIGELVRAIDEYDSRGDQ